MNLGKWSARIPLNLNFSGIFFGDSRIPVNTVPTTPAEILTAGTRDS